MLLLLLLLSMLLLGNPATFRMWKVLLLRIDLVGLEHFVEALWLGVSGYWRSRRRRRAVKEEEGVEEEEDEDDDEVDLEME